MKTIVQYINNVLNESALNEGSYDAEISVKKVMKDILNKKMTLDEISDILGEDGWEYICNNGDVAIFKRKLKNIINS